MRVFGKIGRYLHNFAAAEDQAANVLLTNGKPDETISSHSQRAADRGNWVGKFVSWSLSKLQSDHGHKAMQGDLKRAEEIENVERSALKSNRKSET